MKCCVRCKIILSIDNFRVNKTYKDGLHCWCKRCQSEYSLKWKRDNPDKVAKSRKKHRQSHPFIKKVRTQNEIEKQRSRSRKWVSKNKEKLKEYRLNNIEAYKNYQKEYSKERRNNDPSFKLRGQLSMRLYSALKSQGAKKINKTNDLIGCTITELKSYLEALFLPEMSWKNHGEWHIDHIKPCASFDLTDPEQQKLCFHYTNIQPLFSITTLIDGVEYIGNLNKNKYI